jgi:ubiquinone/menaquinone biosynthesis C-methylase UbiE
MNTGRDSSIQPSEYSQDYFLTDCDGHREYLADKGVVLSDRLQTVWHHLRVEAGMRVLDLGCGRGEITVQCGLIGARAVGVDYSSDGIDLAREALQHAETLQRDMWRRPHLAIGNAKLLPFRDNAFSRAVMSDLVEHLHPDELAIALREVYRVLAPGGRLLIHTMPNLWYYRLCM